MSGFLRTRNTAATTAGHDEYEVPMVATVCSIILAVVSVTLLSAFFGIRFIQIREWRKLPLVGWVIFAIYIDSWLFVAISSVLRWGPGINMNWDMCSAAIFLCLACYLSTKLIYFFLVEKAFVVWGDRKSRMKSKLYLFNSFGMLSVFAIIGIFNFIYRITYLDNGKCVIGMQRPVLIPLVSFDLAVNIYLTILFLIPLWKTYSFNMKKTTGNAKLRDLVVRTFIGAVTSTITCLLNIVIMMALDGEPGWMCLMSCNIDLLFDAIIVQYVTSRDNRGTQTTRSYEKNNNHTAVTVERSVAIQHSRTRKGGGSSGGGMLGMGSSNKGHDIVEMEEEIGMSDMGVAPAGSTAAYRLSERDSKGDYASERSTSSVNDMEMGNSTNVIVITKDSY
ncbi:hypothetical protein PFICI_03047 [Pestalotiopsis fici W106-1]|uniref:G-protein coupled receptors family 1 profile domain-containing protein n=1 Tax=Pestalotiopsis fici (strain W106-1 / CGMCC3.15140) TaxID=1229662 RepID=W3XHV3_PESFW|nr:uncharacterized protein PFICI_03047 [Pestalotiopsis fici W106-1]ETS85022.1 hypothetical protein PFICI_03047 [Pestalotiopsis fici W106-1]